MLKRTVIKLFLIIIGSVAALVAADLLLFTFGTWDGWRLIPAWADEDDFSRWVSHYGSDPAPFQNVGYLPPPAIPGRDGHWLHRAGAASPVARGFGGPLATGLLAYSIEAKSPVIQGRAISSAGSKCLVEVGVALPYVMLERFYSGPSAVSPPHPSEWSVRIVAGAMAANAVILIALIGGPIFFRDVRAIIRLVRGRCSRCGYILLTEQDRCPECGASRESLL
jgi:hypothetical protein